MILVLQLELVKVLCIELYELLALLYVVAYLCENLFYSERRVGQDAVLNLCLNSCCILLELWYSLCCNICNLNYRLCLSLDFSSLLGLSARACSRIIKLARTIADISDKEDILPEHIAEAAGYRFLDKQNLL